jgi:hypothetical protein
MTITSSSAITNGIGYDKIRYVGANAILGNLTANATTIQEVTTGDIVAAGDGIKNATFGVLSGAMIHAWDAGTSTHSYSVTGITTTSAASNLVKTGTDKSITADSLKIGSVTTLSIDATYTDRLNINTQGSITALQISGSSTSSAVTTLTGTFDATLGTVKADDITTGAVDTVGDIVGNWKVGTSSTWDVTSGTLKSTTLKTGANTTTGDIEGNWSLTASSIINTKLGTLRSKTLDAGNVTTTYTLAGSTGTTLKVANTAGIVAGMFVRGVGFTSGQTVTAVASGDTVTLTLSAVPDLVLVNGASLTFITPGTINGAWTVNGTLTLGGISDLKLGTGSIDARTGTLYTDTLNTGASSTTGLVTGAWTVDTGSTFVASTVQNQANSATITATNINTPSQIVQRDANGNFTAGTMTGTATKANDLTGGVLGSLPYQNAENDTVFLAPNVQNVKKYLMMPANADVGAAPEWTTLGVIDAIQTANTIYAGPTVAPSATPTFRAMVAADIPTSLVVTITELKTNILTANNSGLGVVKGAWTLDASAKFEATYADLAEYYEGDQEYEPGTVLVFGGDKEVTTTTVINDTRSAGVVSTDPAYTMNHAQTGIRVCIALAGRVPCKVVGRVKKGDMLTTAATPGYAVKALNPTLGSIIGKALEDKDYGEAGVIQVAIGRV